MNQSQEQFESDDLLGPDILKQNMIKKTLQIIQHMTKEEKLSKAKAHIIDALRYKRPRHESQSLHTPWIFKFLYAIQSSSPWDWMLFISGWIFIFLAALDNQSYATKIGMESTILILFWLDTGILMYCKTFDRFYKKSQYSNFSYFKILIIILMTIDLIVFITLPGYNSRPIRPFRILRCFVPLLFDPQMRKSMLALASTYKDILVYFIFFTFIICGYSLLGNRSLTFDPNFKDSQYPQNVDLYKTNYGNLGNMIFIIYVTATYDSYPDNQNLAAQNYLPNMIYFVVFIFANMFLFSSIPGSIIFIKFKDTRSKTILVDEIKQQHSLLLAFVTLAQNQANLSIDKFIEFLLYLYRYKIRYVEYITDICLKIDENNKRSIQVNQFMQLSKILLSNSAMLPPAFDDLPIWIQFRRWMNTTFLLKYAIKHWLFQLIISIVIILSFINAIFFMFYPSDLTSTFDVIFIWVFAAELIIRIIAYGPEVFFLDRWNIVDTVLVIFGVVFFFVPNSNNADGIIRMSRIFRLATLLRLISRSRFLKGVQFEIWSKLKNIFSILLEIMPIILKFMHLFAFFFYIYAIFGMEVFYNFYDAPAGIANYYNYVQFGNFANFVNSLLLMVQVLTEAGWSQVAFDHSWRAPYYYGYILFYFCFTHITIVYIIATLIKGIFWEVFLTVNQIFEKREKETIEEELKEEINEKKAKEIQHVNQVIQSNEYLEPDTILKRQIIDNKFDLDIFKKLIKVYDGKRNHRSKSHSHKRILTHLMIDDLKIKPEKSHLAEERIVEESRDNTQSEEIKEKNTEGEIKKRKVPLREVEQIEQQDFQTEISQILEKIIVNPKLKYTQLTVSPKLFIDFLRSKLKYPHQFIKEQGFNMHSHPLNNEQSMYTHIYQIHSLLNIQPSKRQQKALIITKLVEQGILSQEQGQNLVKKKLQEKVFNVDSNGALRMLFLAGTDEDLIQKFQCEYFSDIYGYSYKRINKMTLQPLLKFQATLIYSLANILRYPQINTTEFFEMITHIEDKFSNRLLQKGSLFKFVYKLDCQGDIWFSVQYKRQQQMKVHFLKTGLWCFDKQMKEKKVMYGKDIFNWEIKSDRSVCEQYIKHFFQSFQGLAFSLLDEEQFFKSNPCEYVYDLYLQHFDVEKLERYQSRKLQISKIMVVILSKEEERTDMGLKNLPYSLSDIKRSKGKAKKDLDFKFDEQDDETFEKLRNLAAKQVQKIVDSQGLPFSYILNLMKQISEMVEVNGKNFVYQIEKVLNEEYEEMRYEFRHN